MLKWVEPLRQCLSSHTHRIVQVWKTKNLALWLVMCLKIYFNRYFNKTIHFCVFLWSAYAYGEFIFKSERGFKVSH